MYKEVQNCKNCGAGLTFDDMKKTNCPYCNTVYPHKSQAAQHAQVAGQVMNQMMAQQAQVQNQWRGAFGAPPLGPGGPPGGPPPGQPGQPYNPNQMINAHMQHAQQMGRNITMIVMISLVGTFLLIGGIMLVVFLAL